MQFGIFTVSDETTDPTTGHTPDDAERIAAALTIAQHAEEVGLDVFALGEHHNPPFYSSSPTTTLARIAATTTRLQLSTSTTLITTNDPVKIAEDYAMLQYMAEGRVDLMMGRGNTGPVYPWFGKDIREGIPLAVENYALLRRLWDEEVVTWEGRHRTPLRGFTSTPRPLDGIPPFVWHGSIRSPEIAEQAAYYGDGFFHNHIFWPPDHTRRMVALYRQRYEHHGHGPAKTAIVGLGGQVFMRRRSQDAVAEFRPYFDNAPVYGHGPSLEEFTEMTPLTVGSPQQVIDRTLGFRDYVGDYQRQLFLIDHAGLPLKTVLEQLDLLGGEVVPVLRREFEALRDPEVPSDPPTHASLLAARRAAGGGSAVGAGALPGSSPAGDIDEGGAARAPRSTIDEGGAGHADGTSRMTIELARAARVLEAVRRERTAPPSSMPDAPTADVPTADVPTAGTTAAPDVAERDGRPGAAPGVPPAHRPAPGGSPTPPAGDGFGTRIASTTQDSVTGASFYPRAASDEAAVDGADELLEAAERR